MPNVRHYNSSFRIGRLYSSFKGDAGLTPNAPMNGAGSAQHGGVRSIGWLGGALIFPRRFELDALPCDESFPFEALPICTAFRLARQGPQVLATPQLGSA